MSNTKPEVSIVIRCFNEEKHIGTLLKAIYQQTVKNIEVIVVDSGSTDETLKIVGKHPVKIIQISPDEFTFGYSLNKGCEAANGKYFVFASAHVVPVNNDWIEQLLVPFKDPNVALVYGKQTGNTTTKYSEYQLFLKQYPSESNFCQRTPFCNNANVAIRKTMWEKQKYDEALTGLEDIHWLKLMIEQGYYAAYNTLASVVHIHEEDALKILNRYKREAIALKRIFPDSHLSFFEFLSLLLSNIVLDMLRALKNSVLIQSVRGIFIFRFMQYWGTYRGLNYRSPLTHEMIMKFYYPRSIARFQKMKST